MSDENPKKIRLGKSHGVLIHHTWFRAIQLHGTAHNKMIKKLLTYFSHYKYYGHTLNITIS